MENVAPAAERFDRYMERCLYGPDGFYDRTGSAGRARGDFITSPEVGPLFGAVFANALDRWWIDAGRPDPWTVYDVGCGPGTLLRSVAAARPPAGGSEAEEWRRPWRLVGVDVSADGAELRTLPDDLTGSVVVANELLDNLPFRIVERVEDGTWAEVFVEDGRESLRPVEVRLDIAPGTRAPLVERAASWCAQVLDRGADHLLVIDYGAATTAELARRGGWLRTYRQHQRGHDPYRDPGRCDITTDVPVDQLPPDAVVTTQAEFLERWGIDDLVAEGRRYWAEHAAAPDLVAIRMRSRVSEAEALTDPDGLGSWFVAHWARS